MLLVSARRVLARSRGLNLRVQKRKTPGRLVWEVAGEESGAERRTDSCTSQLYEAVSGSHVQHGIDNDYHSSLWFFFLHFHTRSQLLWS